MFRLIVLVLVCAGGYWFYTGPFKGSRVVTPEQRAADNARAMERCVRQERSVSVGGAMAGAMTVEANSESVCADKLQLEQRDGQWFDRL